jgi:glycosyl-4,4'-diaponeurosporenoate acyltransferase
MFDLGLTEVGLVVFDVFVWGVVSLGSGYLFHRRPVSSFDHDSWLTRLRPFEADGRVYQRRLRLLAWKDRLPEAGALFAGGVSKARLPRRSTEHLERFVVETRRAEVTHWAVMAAGPFFFLWNPWYAGVLMQVYAVAANLPFIVIQRFNRARLLQVLDRRRRLQGRSGQP